MDVLSSYPATTVFKHVMEVDWECEEETDDISSLASFPAFSSCTQSSHTSASEGSQRSASPAPSVYSVTSSVRAAAYRELHGRALNNYSEVYRLPADDDELDRLGELLCAFWLVCGDRLISVPRRHAARDVQVHHGQIPSTIV
jgi:hypothetical protein